MVRNFKSCVLSLLALMAGVLFTLPASSATWGQDTSRNPLGDTVKFRMENGKYIGPDKRDLKQWRENKANNFSKGGTKLITDTLSVMQDSLMQRQLYSRKRLKEIYDSLGIGRLDSVLALAKIKQNISSEELLKMVNAPLTDPSSSFPDVSKYQLSSGSLGELMPIAGQQLKPLLVKVKDSIYRTSGIPNVNIDSISRQANLESLKSKARTKLLDSLNRLRPDNYLVGKRNLDSLTQELDSIKHTSLQSLPEYDSVLIVKDSVVQAMSKRKLLVQDSIRNLQTSLAKEQVSLMQSRDSIVAVYREEIYPVDSLIRHSAQRRDFTNRKVSDMVTELKIDRENQLLKRFYFDGIVSFSSLDQGRIHLSPTLGIRVIENFSLAVGPNINLYKNTKRIGMDVGYRAFARYEVFRQRGYIQLEDLSNAGAIKSELLKKSNHSILAGLGGLVPVSSQLAINLACFYRMNNESYSQGVESPWVFRVGISFFGNNKTNSK